MTCACHSASSDVGDEAQVALVFRVVRRSPNHIPPDISYRIEAHDPSPLDLYPHQHYVTNTTIELDGNARVHGVPLPLQRRLRRHVH